MFSACDLEPKISSLPDSVGDFISERYPALLADPETEPEIYNSAVTDYGVYESPDLYGTNATNDYVNYANASDYVLPTNAPEETPQPETKVESKKEPVTESEQVLVKEKTPDDVLNIPERRVEQTVQQIKKEKIKSDKIIVKKGDTLYSLARENDTAVKELIAINNLTEPYVLHPGQELMLVKPVVKNNAAEPVQDLVIPERKPVEQKNPDVKKSESAENKKSEVSQSKPVVSAPKAENKKPVITEAKVETKQAVKTKNITVSAGDTLYSVSRRYAIPVNDLAVMNGLRAPFTLKNGQSLRVPDVPEIVNKETNVKKVEQTVKAPEQKKTEKNAQKNTEKSPKKPEQKSVNTAKSGVQKKQETKKVSEKTKPESKKTLATQPKIAARSSSKFSWPVRGTVLSHFGAKSGGLFNDGINIGAASGTTVKAAENGVVAYAGNEIKGMGNLVIIQHEGGWMTVYAHLNSMSVRRGARVKVGDKIGSVGQTGKVTKPQLHFEIRKGTKAYNPVNYLKK